MLPGTPPPSPPPAWGGWEGGRCDAGLGFEVLAVTVAVIMIMMSCEGGEK
jgi:hypothetical protein